MDDIYKNIEEYNRNKNRKILILFDYMIANILNKKKLNLIVAELFIRGRTLNISLVFITQSYFAVLNSTRCFMFNAVSRSNICKRLWIFIFC